MARNSSRAWVPVLTLLVVGAVLLAVLLRPEGASTLAGQSANTNALLVHRLAGERLLVGTDDGAFESLDSGLSWRRSGLEGRRVSALARLKDGRVWAGGHGFLARSLDGGRSWADVRPPDLPSLDVRALSGSRDVGGRLEAAIGGEGIFRSDDGGSTFGRLGPSSEVGSAASALAETIDGVIFLSDQHLGVVVNANGDGQEWIEMLSRSPASLAPNYGDLHNALLLAGTGEGIIRTTDKGVTWEEVLRLEGGAGCVAFSPDHIGLAYAIASDGTAYRSTDFGASWVTAVEAAFASAAADTGLIGLR